MADFSNYDAYLFLNNEVELKQTDFSKVRQVKLKSNTKPYNSGSYGIFDLLNKIRCLSKKYDEVVVNFYHLGRNTLLLSFMIKHLFPNVYVYIKLDIQNEKAKELVDNTRAFKNKIIYFLLNSVDVLSAETSRAFNYLKNAKGNIANRVYLIPNGVFLEDNLIDLKSDNYIDEKEKIIFTAGRLESYQKNTKLLVDSYLKSGLWQNGWQLVLAGSYDKEIENYIKEKIISVANNHNNCISLTGHLNREQLFSYMRRAKIFALSSRWEGFALVLPEAVAHGCIIAATDVGGVEDVTNNGSLGFIAKEQNVASFTKVLELAAASSPELAKKQREFGLSNFDWKDICNKLAETLDEKIK